MRTSLIVLGFIVPLLGLGALAAVAVPALANNDNDNDVCTATRSVLPSGPIDLEAIPAQQVSGPLTVRGAGLGCDDEDDDHGGEYRGHDRHEDDD
jgi:hypothetical protein